MKQSTESEKKASMRRVSMCYSEISADETGIFGQRVGSKEQLNSLIGRVEQLENMVVETIV